MKLPPTRFQLFGLGDRPKLLYRSGSVWDVLRRSRVQTWPVVAEHFRPADYAVDLDLSDGRRVTICDDEDALWIDQQGQRKVIGQCPVRLPRFDEHPHAHLLRVLLGEILVTIEAGAPLPNHLAYRKPWYRDAAMTAMVLAKTGNLHLIRDWIIHLTDPFDRNNAGDEEPDNLGQLLYLIWLTADASHPLVGRVLRQARRFTEGHHIVGRTDGAVHPVYQTKWLKFGLRSLGLADPYRPPDLPDSYSPLVWWAFTDHNPQQPHFSPRQRELYPYLAWAEDHFYGVHATPPSIQPGCPLSYEAHASQADYQAMRIVDPGYVTDRIATPHSWHAAEMFLYWQESQARES
ncbi:MAG TPA: hypothetical protein VMZ31_07405 [Phycisphaerae bacterium]|nr:hypothetical protein [Phycisphaerae bacterium]